MSDFIFGMIVGIGLSMAIILFTGRSENKKLDERATQVQVKLDKLESDIQQSRKTLLFLHKEIKDAKSLKEKQQ